MGDPRKKRRKNEKRESHSQSPKKLKTIRNGRASAHPRIEFNSTFASTNAILVLNSIQSARSVTFF